MSAVRKSKVSASAEAAVESVPAVPFKDEPVTAVDQTVKSGPVAVALETKATERKSIALSALVRQVDAATGEIVALGSFDSKTKVRFETLAGTLLAVGEYRTRKFKDEDGDEVETSGLVITPFQFRKPVYDEATGSTRDDFAPSREIKTFDAAKRFVAGVVSKVRALNGAPSHFIDAQA